MLPTISPLKKATVMTKVKEMELITTYHMIDDVETLIEPWDEAMDLFRAKFHVVAGCNVMPDGKTMIYSMKGGATIWLRSAKNIIVTLNLPLRAELVDNLCGTFLHIIYKPL